MIAYLSGKLHSKAASAAIVDVGGVGYEVLIPLSTYYELGESGTEVSLQVHTHVREDAILLYGFHTAFEKDLFLKLTSVSGVGPKLGLALLSGLSAADLVRAIVSNNLPQLVGIPGVGRKTAERLVVELRDKLKTLALEGGAMEPPTVEAGIKADVVSALVNLGWQQALAEKAVASALKDEQRHDFQWILKQSLKRLYK